MYWVLWRTFFLTKTKTEVLKESTEAVVVTVCVVARKQAKKNEKRIVSYITGRRNLLQYHLQIVTFSSGENNNKQNQSKETHTHNT